MRIALLVAALNNLDVKSADVSNAYINTLSYGRLPIEYKLLDYRPTLWTPYKTALVIASKKGHMEIVKAILSIYEKLNMVEGLDDAIRDLKPRKGGQHSKLGKPRANVAGCV